MLLLHAYEQLRYKRTTETQASSRLNQKIFHLPDGPEQRARDDSMREAMLIELGASDSASPGYANQWVDKEKNAIQFDYDADMEANAWWEQEGEHMLRSSTLARM